jgi:hypothetical protein
MTVQVAVAWVGAFCIAVWSMPAQTPRVDSFAAAEQLLSNPWPSLHGNRDAWNFCTSPDGKHVAWFAVRDGNRIDAADARPLELLVGNGEGAAPQATLLHQAAAWPDYQARGPVWLPDSSGVLVGYDTRDEQWVTTAHVLIIDLEGKRQPFMQLPNAGVQSVAISHQGRTIVVMTRESAPGEVEHKTWLRIYDRAGKPQSAVETKMAPGLAAPSPDGRLVALSGYQELFAGEVGDLKLRSVGPVLGTSVIAGMPQWCEDSQRFLTVAGGGVAFADAEKGMLQRWSEQDLGGRAAEAVLLPGDGIAAAIVRREVDGNLLRVFLGAGHAPRKEYADLVWLNLTDGTSQRSRVSVRVDERGRHQLPYLERLSELLARYAR